VLYAFEAGNDGWRPAAGVVLDKSGNVFGTTEDGGTGQNCGAYGCGTAFEVSAGGSETILHSFTGGSDGEVLYGPLLLDKRGNVYGMTAEGGTYNDGTIFKVTPKGTESIVHAFAGGSDGYFPMGGLIADAEGNMYGTTYAGGGSSACSVDCGTVFELGK
jgi:uncharacterized repeat protein (TIGR03803 family)